MKLSVSDDWNLATGEGADLLLVTGAPTHPLWRQAYASKARAINLVVAGGGPPARGLAVFADMSLDIAKSTALALSRDPQRSAVVLTVAPQSRGDARRTTVVVTDLLEPRWERHQGQVSAALADDVAEYTVLFADGQTRTVKRTVAGDATTDVTN